MARILITALITAVLLTAQARAITLDEIPPDVRLRLPDFLFYLFPPEALNALSLEDITEIADAWQSGEFHFVNDVQVMERSGPLDPELALLVLQVPRGAPYIEKRFLRMAKAAMGQGIFSSLKWRVFENMDSSVDLQLYYSSGDPKAWIPDIGFSVIQDFVYGVKYQDLYYGGENKQLQYGASTAAQDADEVNAYASFSDNTLNRGRNSYSVSASVRNEGRRRRNLTPAVADIRDRTLRVDGSYGWNGRPLLGLPGGFSAGAGIYNQNHFVIAGDPTAEGTAPRSDFDQSGTAGYMSLAWGGSRKNLMFTPSDGRSYVARLEQHHGAFDFTRFNIDVTKYIPVDNVLGHGIEPVVGYGNLNDMARQFPAASIAVQAQASIADGDVPYSQEVRLGNTANVRGVPYDYYAGTKLLALRAEYRFALDAARQNEAFVFTDHALLGETFAGLESHSTAGFGSIFRLPIYGGFKAGAYYAFELDGSEDSWGLSLGYQF